MSAPKMINSVKSLGVLLSKMVSVHDRRREGCRSGKPALGRVITELQCRHDGRPGR
jgi:hypothetical protein